MGPVRCGTLPIRFYGRPSFLGTRFWCLTSPVMSDAAECPCTLVLQFPAEVYRSSGESVVLPELLKSVDLSKVRCVQFIRNGLVRVTYNDATTCDAAMSGGITFRGQRLPVSPVSARSRLVYVRDLPAEVPNPFVKTALCSYGTVHEVTAMEHSGYPGLLNGTRLVKVTLESDIPSTVHIRGFDCRVWYQGQPQACAVCRSYRHRVRECPLNGLCRRCHQAGHVARECREPRRPSNVHHEPLSVLVDSSEVVESNDEANEVDFESCEESDDSSSISEGEEVLASGDESVLAEGSVDLPPRSSVPVTVSAEGSSPDLPSRRPVTVAVSAEGSIPDLPSRRPVTESSPPPVSSSVVVSSAVVTPVVSSKISVGSPDPKSPVKSSEAPKRRVKSPVKSPAKSSASSELPVKSSEKVPKWSSESERVASGVSKTLVPPSITGYAVVFKDRESVCGVSRIDFGALTRDVLIKDKHCFEYNRFVNYVHRDCPRAELSIFAQADVCHDSKRLRPGEPQKFPGQ